MSTPFFFREAIVVDVDTRNLTCDLLYGDLNSGEISHGVPMPNLVGAGNAGFITNLMKGTRVIAAYLHDKSRDPVVIVAVLPSNSQKLENYNSASSYLVDKNSGTIAYPKTLSHGDTYISAHSGPNIWLKNNDSLFMSSKNGNGLFLVSGLSGTHNLFYLSNNHSMEGSGGRLSWGRIKRSMSNTGWSSLSNFNTDMTRDSKLKDIGFWLGDRVSQISTAFSNRNPGLSEYKLIINEFATEFGFSGFDKELEKNSNSILAMQKNPSLARDRESGNSLRLSEGELLEIIAGNMVDINGLLLDLNYNPLLYDLNFPTLDATLKTEEAFRKSRRGIGYHFKLSTNVKSSDPSTSLTDFIFDIDKEGVLKLNIPKSSTTGNIPYISNVNFNSQKDPRLISIASGAPTIREKIPVNLRDSEGNVLDQTPPGTMYRETGIRFENLSNDTYFPVGSNSGKKTIRINTTKHHNIYAAAERLIANYVREIHIPATFTREKSLVIGGQDLGSLPEIPSDPNKYSRHSSFEIKYQSASAEDANDPDNQTDVKNLFYSTVSVFPDAPAISTGGDTFVAGKPYSADDPNQPLISNYFKTSQGDNGVEVSVNKNYENVVTHGGVSANVNLEGSLEMSIGSDNVDSKSIVLDTAGSLVAWFGKDNAGRSAVIQSDGDILVNVGGSYTPSSNPNADPTFNPGRFDLRVNVIDKGFYDSNGNRSRNGATITDDAPYSSDYIISISENGLVISGMKAGAPMVIRNDGPVMMESASDKLILKGMQVEIVEFAKLPTDDGRSRR